MIVIVVVIYHASIDPISNGRHDIQLHMKFKLR